MGREQETPGAGRGHAPGSVATRFQKGRSGNPHGRRGKPPPPDDWPADLLGQMKRVFGQPPSQDKRPEEKVLRAYLAKQPKAYFDQMRSLENEARERERQGAQADATPAEPKTAALVRQIDELLDKILAETFPNVPGGTLGAARG